MFDISRDQIYLIKRHIFDYNTKNSPFITSLRFARKLVIKGLHINNYMTLLSIFL